MGGDSVFPLAGFVADFRCYFLSVLDFFIEIYLTEQLEIATARKL